MKTEYYTFKNAKFAWLNDINTIVMDFGAYCESRKVSNKRNGWHLTIHPRSWYTGDVIVAIKSQRVVSVNDINDCEVSHDA